MPTKDFIRIGGVNIPADGLQLPSTGRTFRDAWALNGDVIEVDMAVAKRLHVERLVRSAEEQAAAADARAKLADALGDAATEAAERAKGGRLKGKASASIRGRLNRAASLADLEAITLDDLYPA